MSKTYPGVIKAFHYHEDQDDLRFFPTGNAKVVLYDRRENSPTKGETNVFYLGEDNPILLLIPKDEKRIPWDDPAIGFDWVTKNR